MDSLCSKLRMKHGEPQEEDCMVADKHLENLHYLCMQENLNVIPEINRMYAMQVLRHWKYTRG
jgi:hypothetical protein